MPVWNHCRLSNVGLLGVYPTQITIFRSPSVWGAQTVLGIVVGGGAGSRLNPLTKKRALTPYHRP